jgi:hypothetical protein
MTLFALIRSSLLRTLLLGFLAGFVSTLTFHQITIALLAALGALQASAYNLQPVPPLGTPQVINLAFWGGVWGCVWALIAPRVPRGMSVWLAGLVFGALLPSLVGWFVVAPLKGQPIAAGWNVARLWIAPVVNGVWGLGTALVYELLQRLGSGRRSWLR